jgi:prepilin-type N-terminal cleavage/methylation domain-containing protein
LASQAKVRRPLNAAGDGGFSLVEVVVAMLILGIIAVALVPPLWQGLQLSAEQSTVATATRQLNGLIEEARDSPSCGTLDSIAVSRSFTDGRGQDFTTQAQSGYACAPGSLVYIELTARDSTGAVITSVAAKIFAE